jgi:excisionase family DNA binding protein
MVQSPLLTLRETTAYLRISLSTLRRMIAYGAIPVVRIGKGVRVRQSDLETLIGIGMEMQFPQSRNRRGAHK